MFEWRCIPSSILQQVSVRDQSGQPQGCHWTQWGAGLRKERDVQDCPGELTSVLQWAVRAPRANSYFFNRAAHHVEVFQLPRHHLKIFQMHTTHSSKISDVQLNKARNVYRHTFPYLVDWYFRVVCALLTYLELLCSTFESFWCALRRTWNISKWFAVLSNYFDGRCGALDILWGRMQWVWNISMWWAAYLKYLNMFPWQANVVSSSYSKARSRGALAGLSGWICYLEGGEQKLPFNQMPLTSSFIEITTTLIDCYMGLYWSDHQLLENTWWIIK